MGCITYAKGTTLKANHNNWKNALEAELVVLPMLKVRLWKQITTVGSKGEKTGSCITYAKGTTLKANHNIFKIHFK